jgi:hypothetical protein
MSDVSEDRTAFVLNVKVYAEFTDVSEERAVSIFRVEALKMEDSA